MTTRGEINSNFYQIVNVDSNGAPTSVKGEYITSGSVNQADHANVADVANNVSVGNITGIGNIAVINLDGNVSNVLHGNGYWGPESGNLNANYANFAGTAFNVSGSNVTGSVANATYSNISGVSYSVSGSNVSGTVANANYSAYAGVSNSANSVNVANVVGIGNIATVNLTGSTSNILYGNGVFAAVPTVSNVATANFANYAGNVVTAAQPNITSLGTLTGLSMAGNIIPTTDVTYDLGNATNRFKDLYLSGNTLYLGPQTITANASGISVSGNLSGDASGLSNIAGANVTGQVGNALIASTVYTNAQPNITSLGNLTSLTVSGDAGIAGNLSVGGNLTYINVTNLVVQDPVIEMGGGPNGAPLTTNDGKDRGSLLHYYTTQPVDAFMGWDNSNGEFAFGSNVTNANDVMTFNTLGNVRAQTFIGNLTGLASSATVAASANSVAGANVSGEVSFAATANSVAVANVSGIGNIATVNLTGSTSNVLYGNGVFAAVPTISNVANANYANFAGTAYNVSGSNVTGEVANANYATYSGTAYSVSGSNVVGTVANSNYAAYAGTSYSVDGANVVGYVANSNHATIADSANSVSVANVSGIGNIAVLNLDGSSSNVLYGNGQFATITIPSGTGISNGTSNINIPVANGNINISTNNNANIAQFDTNGTLFMYPTTSALNAIRISSYGTPSANDTSRIASFRYRGNASAPLSVEPNDVTMRFLTVAYNGSGLQTNSVASIRALVDASYTANGANIPLGWNLQVNDTNGGTNNQTRNHYFYSNGNISFNRSLTVNNDVTSTSGVFYGNGSGLTNLTGANVVGDVSGATHANVADLANSVSVSNVSGIGNIATLNLDGNASNILFGNGTFAAVPDVSNVANANYANFAGTAYSVSGSNVTGTVANANYSAYAGTSDVANSVAVANVTGIGNIAVLNLDGNSSNLLYGNGTFAPVSITSVANANYANFANLSSFVSIDSDFSNTTNQQVLFAGVVAGNTQIKYDTSFNYNSNSNTLNVGNTINSQRFVSNIATGTAPFVVTSTTLVANLNVAQANVADTANSVSVANVSGIGNIAVINLNGNSSEVLYGNGVFALAGGGGGTPGGSNTELQFNSNGVFGGISTVTWNGSNLSLGAVGNVKITGGVNNDFIKTDGTGNLSFVSVAETLLVGTRAGPYTVPITNYTFQVTARTGNVTVYVN